jgi:hypothetical protein
MTKPKIFLVKKMLIGIILLAAGNLSAYGQVGRTFANQVIYVSSNQNTSLLGCGFGGLTPCQNSVLNVNNAIINDDTYARVTSSSGVAVALGAYQGEIELKFASPLSAGKTSYMRINANSDLLKVLLGGNLGSLLTTVVGSVILGNKYFEAGARMGTGSINNVLMADSQNGLSNNRLRLIKDANGFFYLAITPAQAYDRVYIKDFTNAALGLGSSSYTDVYYAFTTSGTDPCGTTQGFATGYEGTGLTLDLLGLGRGGVVNPENVINTSQTDFSEISLGVLGVNATMSQNVYFENLSNADDDLTIKIKVNSALINLGLLNNISITAFNGVDSVYTSNLASNVNLDLLGLLSSGAITTIPLSPGVVYNRVKVTIKSLLGVNLTQSINLYAVSRTNKRPTFTSAPNSNSITVCSNTSTKIYATTDPTNQLLWYDAITGGNLLFTSSYNSFFATPVLTATKTYYVSAKKTACPSESERVPVTVTVNTLEPGSIGSDQIICSATIPAAFTSNIATAAAGIISYQWQKSTDNITFADIPNAKLSSYNEVSALTTKTYFRRISTSTLNGVVCSAFSNVLVVTINPLPTLIPTVANVCKGISYTILNYTGTNITPITTYSIKWSPAAQADGFINITDGNLTTSPLTITVPVGVNITTYSGSLTVTNGNTCSSIPVTININVHNIPPSPSIAVQ